MLLPVIKAPRQLHARALVLPHEGGEDRRVAGEGGVGARGGRLDAHAEARGRRERAHGEGVVDDARRNAVAHGHGAARR